MSLSPIEFAEEDCGCTSGLYITPFSKQHIRCLKGKYWKKLVTDDWQLMNGDEFDLIDQRIIIRSPMTCQTKDFKICHKCFGEKHTRTDFIGIVGAQVLTERLTQLLMRSFHKKYGNKTKTMSGCSNSAAVNNDYINEIV